MRHRSMRCAVGLCVVMALVVAGCTGTSQSPVSSTHSASAVSRLTASRLILHGRLRCTARVSSVLQAGHKTGLSFTLHNVTTATVTVALSQGSFAFVLRAAGGMTYDSTIPFEAASGPAPIPTPLPAGATRTFHPADVWVRWAGPVSIQPSCSGITLPTLRTTVTAPGPTPGATRAIADVVEVAGHLFDKCRPARAGVPVFGTIEPPSGHAPAMRARCSIDLHREGSFWVAQSLVVVPPTLRGVHVSQPYERLTMPAGAISAEAIAWEFVDTAEGARAVATSTEDFTKPSGAMAPDWDWTGNRWEGPGGDRCGGQLVTGGSSPHATIEFISVCPS